MTSGVKVQVITRMGKAKENTEMTAVTNGRLSAEHPLVSADLAIPVPEDDSDSVASAPDAAKRWIKKQAHKCCSVKSLKKKLPITSWLPKYNVDCLIGDLIAGLTVGMTVIPQGMAYANLAGLDVQYGLYSAFMGCFVYVIFGSCNAITIGPTAIMSMMTYEHAHLGGLDFAILMCFLSGCVELLLGILNLGFIIDFISVPVTSGFVTAAALSIATSQIGKFFGISVHGHSTVDKWIDVFRNLKDTRLWDAILGACSFALLIFMKEMKDFKWGNRNAEEQSLQEKIAKKTIWLMSTARNAIVVVVCTVIGYCTFDSHPLNLTKKPVGGLPPFQPPPFSTTIGNETLSFTDMASDMGAGIIIVPLIAILENVAIAKAFSKGKAVDASQEMFALGMCNIAGSFVSSYPVTGSFSRTAVNAASGVKTTAGGILTGAVVLLALGVLTSTFQYIPDACLASVIIASVIYTAEFGHLVHIWHTKKVDLLPWILTFVLSLTVNLEYGIIAGIILSLLILLYSTSRPAYRDLNVQGRSDILVVRPKGGLYYPSVSYLRELVNKRGLKNRDKTIAVDCTYVQGADFTTAEGIKALINDFEGRNQCIIFIAIKPGVLRVLEGLKIQLVHYTSLHDIPSTVIKDEVQIIQPAESQRNDQGEADAHHPFLPETRTDVVA